MNIDEDGREGRKEGERRNYSMGQMKILYLTSNLMMTDLSIFYLTEEQDKNVNFQHFIWHGFRGSS